MHYELVSNSVYVFQSDVKTKARRQLPNDDWIRKCQKNSDPTKVYKTTKLYNAVLYKTYLHFFFVLNLFDCCIYLRY